jgi:ribose 5-phosphate isomerase RpiB
MIVTARQLEDLHRQNGGNGSLTLPYRARLTPLAVDWVRAKKVVLGYSDVGDGRDSSGAGGVASAKPQAAEKNTLDAGSFVYWCDGPCGPAKAAVVAQSKESSLVDLDKPADAKQLVSVIKHVAVEVKAQRIEGGILLVQNGALAMVYVNRCPSLRAVMGTCLEAVDQGVQIAAANVLVIEYPYKTLPQVKNLLGRFVRGKRELSEEVRRQLTELASCA